MFFHPPTRVLVVLLLFHVPQAYLAWRLVRGVPRPRAVLLLVALSALQAPWTLFLFGWVPAVPQDAPWWREAYQWASAMWVVGAVGAVLVGLAIRGLELSTRRVGRTPNDDAPVELRRRLVKTATTGAALAPWFVTGYGLRSARLDYRVEHHVIPVRYLPAAQEGLRIVQLTDVHVSDDMTPAQIERIVEVANSLGADLAVLTGDFLAFDESGLEGCVTELSRIEARFGTYGCLG